MPTNRIRVELEPSGNLKCEVWDKDGQLHDVTNIFIQIRGVTSGSSVWNELMLKITQSGGRWSACACFRSLDGGRLDSLKAQAENYIAVAIFLLIFGFISIVATFMWLEFIDQEGRYIVFNGRFPVVTLKIRDRNQY